MVLHNNLLIIFMSSYIYLVFLDVNCLILSAVVKNLWSQVIALYEISTTRGDLISVHTV